MQPVKEEAHLTVMYEGDKEVLANTSFSEAVSGVEMIIRHVFRVINGREGNLNITHTSRCPGKFEFLIESERIETDKMGIQEIISLIF